MSPVVARRTARTPVIIYTHTTAVPTATIRSASDNWLVADLKGGDAGVGTHDIDLTVYAFGLRSL